MLIFLNKYNLIVVMILIQIRVLQQQMIACSKKMENKMMRAIKNTNKEY